MFSLSLSLSFFPRNWTQVWVASVEGPRVKSLTQECRAASPRVKSLTQECRAASLHQGRQVPLVGPLDGVLVDEVSLVKRARVRVQSLAKVFSFAFQEAREVAFANQPVFKQLSSEKPSP